MAEMLQKDIKKERIIFFDGGFKLSEGKFRIGKSVTESKSGLYVIGIEVAVANIDIFIVTDNIVSGKFPEAVSRGIFQCEASLPVTNAGDRDGAVTVQFYVKPVDSSVKRPLKELRGFDKQFLKAGETKEFAGEFDEIPRGCEQGNLPM